MCSVFLFEVAMRADKTGTHRVSFERNKKRLLKTATHCGICGKLVDKLEYKKGAQ